jgi:hypothetical protein
MRTSCQLGGVFLLLSLFVLLTVSLPLALRGADLDRDGIEDGFEETLARDFLPMIWYNSEEACPEPGVILFHVRPFNPGGSVDTLAVTYSVPYYEDCGPNGHSFDLESFAITLYPLPGSPLGYGVYSIRTWAHRGSLFCEQTGERTYDPLRPNVATEGDTLYASWEDIVVSRDKHGFFLDKQRCDGSCFGVDSCGYDLLMNAGRLVPSDQGQYFDLYNIGEINDHLIDNFTEINDQGGYNFGSMSVWNSTWMVDNYYSVAPGPPLPADIIIHSTYDDPLAVCEEQSVSFGLSYRSLVRCSIYDIAGNLVSAQYLGEFCPGDNIMARSWDGLDSDGYCASMGSYYMVLEAYRGDGGASDDHRFGVALLPGYKPNAPTDLQASLAGDQVVLTWTDNSSIESGFIVERRIGSCAFSRLDQVDASEGTGQVTYTDYDVGEGEEVGYRVFAYVTFAGYSAFSNESWVNIPACATDPYVILSAPSLGVDSVYTSETYTVTVGVTDPDCPFVHYDWNVRGNEVTDPGTIYGSGNQVTYVAPRVDCDGLDYASYENEIDVTLTYEGYADSASTGWFTVYCPPSGCPFLYTWDGGGFVAENNLLPMSEISDGNVTDYYQLRTKPIPRDGDYLLEIREDESEHSFIDAVSLMYVDHAPGINSGVTGDGRIFGYRAVEPIDYARDMEGADLTGALAELDGKMFWGNAGDGVSVQFSQSGPHTLVMVTQPGPRQKSIGPIIIPGGGRGGGGGGVGIGVPREMGGLQFIDPFPIGAPEGGGAFDLIWTGRTGLDFVGRATGISPGDDVKACSLEGATHSKYGDVIDRLQGEDRNYAELEHGESIRLRFHADGPADGMERDFVLVTTGYYR